MQTISSVILQTCFLPQLPLAHYLPVFFFSPELNLDPHVCSQGAVSRVFHCPHCSVFSHTTVHKFPHTSTNCPIPQPELLRKENLFYGDVCVTKMQGNISENESLLAKSMFYSSQNMTVCYFYGVAVPRHQSASHHIGFSQACPAQPGKQHFLANQLFP